MKRIFDTGVTDQTIDIFVGNSSSSTGAGLAGLVYNSASLTCNFRKGATGVATALTLANQTVSGAHTDGGFVEISAGNMTGLYRLDLSDTLFDTEGAVSIMLQGAANMLPVPIELQIKAAPASQASVDTIDNLLDTEIAAIKDKTDNLPSSPAAAGDIPSVAAIADAICDEVLSGHSTAGTVGKALSDILADTNEMQTDLVNGGRLDLLVDGIKAKTDALPASPAATGDIPSAATIADTVWLEPIADHSGTAGSTAEALGAAGAAGDPWTTPLPGAYGNGSAGYIIGNRLDVVLSTRASQTSVDDVPNNSEFNARTLVSADYANQTNQATIVSKIDTVDGIVDAIVADTNELQLDWANGGRLDNILDARASQVSVDDLPTNSELAVSQAAADDATLAAIAALNNISTAQVKTQVDTALADAGVTTTRTAYLNNLNVGGLVASSAEVTSIQNNTRVVRVVPSIIERPDSGNTTYRIELMVYDEVGNMEALVSAPTVALVNQAGTDLSSRLGAPTTVGDGHYRWIYTADVADTLEQLVWTFSVTEGAVTRVYGNTSVIVDTTAADFTASDRADLQAILADTADMQPKIGTPVTSVSADIAAVKAQTAAIETDTQEIGAAGAGLTSLPWNAAWDAQVESEVTDALNVYDPPTNTEMVARTLAAASYATAAGVSAVETDTQDIQARLPAALVNGNMSSHVVAMGNNTLTAAALATDAVTEIQNGLATSANITALNNISTADVKTQVDTALTDIHLDHLLATDYNPASKPGNATALFNELVQGNATGVSQFTVVALDLAPAGGGGGGGGDATEANQITIIEAIAALNNISTADVKTQVDTSLVEIHLDHLLAVPYDPDNKPGNGTALLNELVQGNATGVVQFTEVALEETPCAMHVGVSGG